MPVNLTDSGVSAAKTVTGRLELRDKKVRGLALRVTPKGAKSWSCQYYVRNQHRTARVTIGPYPAVSLADARKRAREIMGAVATGSNPAAERRDRANRVVLGEALDLYINDYCKPRLRSAGEIGRSLRKELLPSLGSRALADVKRRDLAVVISRVTARGSPVMANRLLERTRRFCRWCVGQGLIDHAPTDGLAKENVEIPRDRALAPNEIKRLWDGVATAPMSEATRRIMRLLMITGQRRSEVAEMPVAELNLNDRLWTLPPERTKNKLRHVVPLSSLALDIIKAAIDDTKGSAFLFPTPRGNGPVDGHAVSTAMRRTRDTLVFEPPIRTHDFRRTVTSQMAEMGVAESTIARVLNQISGYNSVTSRVYNQYDYLTEKRAALDGWAMRLAAIVDGSEAKVVELRPVS